jgi:hypothetical protein
MIIILPNIEKDESVSTTVKPVTQAADVAVNIESVHDIDFT